MRSQVLGCGRCGYFELQRMVAQLPLYLSLLFGYQSRKLSAHSSYGFHEFPEIEGRGGPKPFGLDLLQSPQQKLPNPHSKLQYPKSRLRNPRALVVKLPARFGGHPCRRPLADFVITVPCDRSTSFVIGRQTRRGQRTTVTRRAAIHTQGDTNSTSYARFRLVQRHRFALWTIVLVLLFVVYETRFI